MMRMLGGILMATVAALGGWSIVRDAEQGSRLWRWVVRAVVVWSSVAGAVRLYADLVGRWGQP